MGTQRPDAICAVHHPRRHQRSAVGRISLGERALVSGRTGGAAEGGSQSGGGREISEFLDQHCLGGIRQVKGDKMGL